jgi:hypothetical protein
MSINSSYERYWESRRSYLAQQVRKGRCIIQYKSTPKGGKLHVACPYHARFNDRAKELSGRWRDRSKVWVFNVSAIRLVVALCHEVYGPKNTEITGYEQVTRQAGKARED